MTQADASSLPHLIDPDSLAALPRTSGVYIFKGEGTLPSTSARALTFVVGCWPTCGPKTSEMIAQSRRVEFIETAGEIGALLLEARLIKQQSPLFNIRLRRLRNLCSIRLAEQDGVVSLKSSLAKRWPSGKQMTCMACSARCIRPGASCANWPISTDCVSVYWGWRRSASGAALAFKSKPAWAPVWVRKTVGSTTNGCSQHWWT